MMTGSGIRTMRRDRKIEKGRRMTARSERMDEASMSFSAPIFACAVWRPGAERVVLTPGSEGPSVDFAIK